MDTIAEQRAAAERLRHPHPLASLSHASRGRRHPQAPDRVRTAYERDGHRILHSKPFRRLRNKTQVFFSPENDHITTRMDHSLYVATISRTICRALGLNDDLAYAAALGHDIGHSAFGHSGERILRRLLNRNRPDGTPPIPYHHEAQSLRVVDELSSIDGAPVRGLNLTYEVRDAIRCHCGESKEDALRPRAPDDVRDLGTLRGLNTDPITLEGCVVRLADHIAYLGRDYEDALVALGDLPPLPPVVAEVLGADNRSIINGLVGDLIAENRREPEAVGFSPRTSEAIAAMRAYNYRNIYRHPRIDRNRTRMDAIIVHIFDESTAWLAARDPRDWTRADETDHPAMHNLARFIDGARYPSPPPPARVIVDWIALMTDTFAFSTFKSLTLPRPVV